MHKAIKVGLNVICGAGIGAVGYFLGYKKGKEKTYEWAQNEINSILESQKPREVVLEEKVADETSLTPEILAQLAFEKADEVEIEPDISENKEDEAENELPVVEEEVIVPKKKPYKRPKKTPYMLTTEEFEEEGSECEIIMLEIDESGDLYYDNSDQLYTERENIGEKLITRMLKDIEDGETEWYIKNDPMGLVFDISIKGLFNLDK